MEAETVVGVEQNASLSHPEAAADVCDPRPALSQHRWRGQLATLPSPARGSARYLLDPWILPEAAVRAGAVGRRYTDLMWPAATNSGAREKSGGSAFLLPWSKRMV